MFTSAVFLVFASRKQSASLLSVCHEMILEAMSSPTAVCVYLDENKVNEETQKHSRKTGSKSSWGERGRQVTCSISKGLAPIVQSKNKTNEQKKTQNGPIGNQLHLLVVIGLLLASLLDAVTWQCRLCSVAVACVRSWTTTSAFTYRSPSHQLVSLVASSSCLSLACAILQ